MQLINNVNIEIVGNRLRINNWYYVLLQCGDVKFWHVSDREEQCICMDSMESATAYTKSLNYKTDDLDLLEN